MEVNNSFIPVTLLSGFLGAGKTTLLNYILKENHGKRIAVIENEFGEISIDHDLVIGADQDIFEMNNGCICCSIRTDLIETLNRLIDRKDSFDYILIESTGLASPGPIAQAFIVENSVDSILKLDGVVTLVDSKHIFKHLQEVEVAWEQIAFSNVILLNKIDLVSKEELERLQDEVQVINPTALIHHSNKAKIDLDQILNIGGFDLNRNLGDDLKIHDHQHSLEDSSVSSITSVGVTLSGIIDENRFVMWLRMLLILDGMDIFRAKGVLCLESASDRYIFQSVYMMYEGKFDRPWGEEPRSNRMIFIGRNLDRTRLEEGVRSCLLDGM